MTKSEWLLRCGWLHSRLHNTDYWRCPDWAPDMDVEIADAVRIQTAVFETECRAVWSTGYDAALIASDGRPDSHGDQKADEFRKRFAPQFTDEESK